MSAGRSLVVVNPLASRIHDIRRRAAVLDLVLGTPALVGSRADVITESDPVRIESAAREAVSGGVERVVALGGDGTVIAVASALAGTPVVLGVVPVGTGNILAGSLGLRGDPAAAVRALRTGRTRVIDLGTAAWTGGRIGGTAYAAGCRRFVVACGAGFDGRVMAATRPEHKRRLGQAAYFVTGARALARVGNAAFRIDVDGRVVEVDAALALIANSGELVPGVIRPRLPILPDDGLLDLVVLRAATPIEGIKGGLRALWSTSRSAVPGSGPAWRTTARRVRIETLPPEPVEVDGDLAGVGCLEASIEPAALRVLVPGT